MFSRTVIILTALAFVALVSCDGDGGNGNGNGGIPDVNSPYEVLVELVYCFNNYQEAGINDRVDATLSSDISFFFATSDVGQDVNGYTIPSSWGKTELFAAIENLFADAFSIDMSFPALADGEDAFGKPDPGDTTFTKNNFSTSLLVMVTEHYGLDASGLCDFEFGKDETATWRITIWRDKTGGTLLDVEPTTVGYILAYYYSTI